MKKLLLMFVICAVLGCKKDTDKTLTGKNWVIESATVTPAMTWGNKTSTNYIELEGPSGCTANASISFSEKGTFLSGSNGALCDMRVDTSIKTWRREGNQIFLSTNQNSPMILDGNRLTGTTKNTDPNTGITYTYVYVYKAQSK